MDENDIYITWLAYPSTDGDNLSELEWSREREGLLQLIFCSIFVGIVFLIF